MRLRKIRYKDGRAPLHILHNTQDNPDDNLCGVIRQHAQNIAEMSDEGSELTGFLMVGIFSDGCSSVGFRAPSSIPRPLLAAYLKEIINRDVVVDNEARDVFDSMFHWEEGQ